MVVLLSERNPEGHVARRFHELELVHDSIPVFPLMWTIAHRITGDSPLAAFDPVSLKDADAQLFVTITARDTALSTDLYDVQSYGPESILFGRVYAKAVEGEQDGSPVADLSKLSDTQPYNGSPDNGELN